MDSTPTCPRWVHTWVFLIKEKKTQKSRRPAAKKTAERKTAVDKKPGKTARTQKDEGEEGIELVLYTAEALISERGGKVFGSMIKQTLKRRRPGFNESAHGFSSFNDLLEEAEKRGFITMTADERSGGYVVQSVKREGNNN